MYRKKKLKIAVVVRTDAVVVVDVVCIRNSSLQLTLWKVSMTKLFIASLSDEPVRAFLTSYLTRFIVT